MDGRVDESRAEQADCMIALPSTLSSSMRITHPREWIAAMMSQHRGTWEAMAVSRELEGHRAKGLGPMTWMGDENS
jgi:hypothetical protein